MPQLFHTLLSCRLNLLLVLLLFNIGHGQLFDANIYYQQCLRFEVSGDLNTARQSCLNALEVNPDFYDAGLALARIEIALGNISSAESMLNRIRKQSVGTESYILLAEVALASERYDEAEGYLSSARSLLSEDFNSQLESRLNFVSGSLAEAKSNYRRALTQYRNATISDGLDIRYRLALARLLFRLGELANARAELEAYQEFTGNTRNAELLSLLGRIKWAQSDLDGAIGDLETAVTLRGTRDTNIQAQDLRALTFIYYGKGDIRAGNLAFRATVNRGTLLLRFLGQILPWLILFIALLATHLIGEGRITSSVSDTTESPIIWSLGQLYNSLFLSVVISLAIALLYSIVRYNNFLAIVTPIQSGDVRALWLASLMLSLTCFAIWHVRENGWNPTERLLGITENIPMAIITGIGLFALTLAYLAFIPKSAWLSNFYLDLSRLTPSLVAAAILIPLGELFFRSFAIPALEKRYDPTYAMLISSAIFSLVLATPLILVMGIGLILAEVFRRSNNGLNTLIAQLVLNLGLVIGVAFVPWVRGLFF